MLFYKVLASYEDNKLYSIYAPGKFIVEYEVGKWTYPVENTNGLMVFKNIDHAINFARSSYTCAVYSCEVKRPRPLKYLTKPNSYAIKVFWEAYNNARKNHRPVVDCAPFVREAPEGTYLVDALKLKERVK